MTYIALEIVGSAFAGLSAVPGAALHLTLAHFEKTPLPKTLELANDLNQLAESWTPINLKATHHEEWEHVGPVLCVALTSGLAAKQQSVLDLLRSHGIEPSTQYDFKPHITLGRKGPFTAPADVFTRSVSLCGAPLLNRFVFYMRTYRDLAKPIVFPPIR